MPTVLTEDRGPVRHVVLNRPEKLNAIDEGLIDGLAAAVRAAADDDAVRCVVLRGAGRMFSAGIDASALGGLIAAPERLRGLRRRFLEIATVLEDMLKPTVAQIHGLCLGGALELALACDLRVMASDARTGLPETRIGLVPDVGGCSRLPAVVGLGRAKELIMTSRPIDGVEAERIGLANRIASVGDLEAATQALVDELLGCAPVAVGLAKRLLDAAAKPALGLTLEQEVTAQAVCVRTADFAEGARALAEQRPPRFSGR